MPLDNIVKNWKNSAQTILPSNVMSGSPSDVQSSWRETHQRFGRIDVLVNNAAIVTHFPTAGATPWPRIRDMDESFGTE